MPLDWDHPNGRTIRLALIRHLASKPEQRIGTMFMNPGGPGDTRRRPGAGRSRRVRRVRRRPLRRRQLGSARHQRQHPGALLPQTSGARRGSGPAQSIPTTNAASERFARKTAALARRCGEVSGWLLPHISTADTVRDLDHLRVLIGEEKLTYLGLSYGTLLGQTYANMFPDRVRAMLLMGIIDAPKALEGGRGEGRQRGRARPTRSSTSSSRSATRRDRNAARSPAAATPRPSASTGCSRGRSARRSRLRGAAAAPVAG